MYRNDLGAWSACGVWQQLTAYGAPGNPVGRYWHPAAWDGSLNRLVVFGGHDGANVRNDLWAFGPPPLDVFFEPSIVPPGGVVQVSAGGLSTGPLTATVRLVDPLTPTVGAAFLGQAPLLNGAFGPLTFTVPITMPIGVYRVQATNGVLTATSVATLTVIAAGPDLVIEHFSAGPALVGQSIPLTITVRNIGTLDTGTGYHVHIFADRETPPTPADLGTVLHMATDFGPLGPGQAQTVVTSLGAGILSPGRHTLWALADGHNAIAELSEANNVATFMLDVVSGNRLGFLAAPVRAAHRYDFGIQPIVVLRDSAGVTLTADSSTVVTLTIKPGTGASGAVLTCDQTQGGVASTRVVSGTATFSGCAIDRPGVGYVLAAQGADAQPGETLAFNVTWAGDSNGDGRVSIVDYSLLVTCFGATPGDARWADPALRCWRADLNGDMVVDVVDHSIVVTRFGTATATPVAPSGPGAGP